MDKKELILKWLDNDLSPEEFEELKAMEDYESYRKLFEHASHFSNPQSVDPQEGYTEIRTRMARHSKVVSLRSRIKYFAGAAAAIAVLVTGYLFYNTQDITNTSTNMAERKEIVLPDASLVRLNAESVISYNEDNWTADRSLDLKGEAFFKVAQGAVFEVKTSGGWVMVTGTEFNVYNRDKLFSVSCYEGSVKVGTPSGEWSLKPGDAVQVLNGNVKTMKIHEVIPTWLEGQSTFQSIPLSAVFAELERQYELEISYNKKIGRHLYTGSFPHNDLKVALESVCKPFGLQYDLSDQHVKISTVE